jgi:outer membrane lipoprotein LolB
MRSRRGCCVCLLGISASTLLAGCAVLAPRAASSAGQSRFSGRMAIRVDASATQGVQAGSFSFDLVGSPTAGQFSATSPLGTLLARVTWQANEARVEANGEADRFASLEAAMGEFGQRAGLRMALPVAALFAWLRGEPLAGTASTATPEGFSQLGWRINTAQARDGRIQADWPGPPAATLRVVLDAPLGATSSAQP